MKHKILITALIAIGFSLSGASHALSVLKADGTRSVANVEGNKLLLRDATGKRWLPASDGTYKTSDGKTLLVQGGIIGPTDSKAKVGVIAPKKQGPDKLLPAVQPAAPGMGSPAATQRGLLMQPDKPGNEVKPGPKPAILNPNAFAQTPYKGPKQGSVTSIVSDSVIKTGSKISGGWREYAADRSWRRVVFRLDGHVGAIVFSDGKPGSLLPSVTHYAASGRGPKGSPASYNEVRTFAGATPGILDKAKTSSPIPSDIATRIGEIGGDIKVMQQLAELMRISELGSALDAMRVADDGGFFPDRPGGSPGEGNWSDPRSGVGRDGRTSDGKTVMGEKITDPDGNSSQTAVTTYSDGSTTTVTYRRDADGGRDVSGSNSNAKGHITGGFSVTRSSSGDTTMTGYTRNINTSEVRYTTVTTSPNGSSRSSNGRVTPGRTAPSEVPFSGRGGFDEAWLYKAMPWFMDAYYLQWKSESDLVKSGGRIKQPGLDEQSTLVLNEGPEVGASGVVNCGATDANNPCARPARVGEDPRGGWGRISQPIRGGEPGAPIGGQAEPRPVPIPEPEPQ